MSESGSSTNGSYFHNTIISWKNKVFSPKVEATLNSNMAAPPHERNLDMVKLDARELATDIVHYVANYQVQPPPNEHARTMRRIVDQVRVKHQILFSSMTKKLELPTEEQEDVQEYTNGNFVAVAEHVFNDRIVNWGRVATLYAFAGEFAKHFVEHDMPDYVDFCGHVVADFVCDYLAGWIHQHGGWVGIFVKSN